MTQTESGDVVSVAMSLTAQGMTQIRTLDLDRDTLLPVAYHVKNGPRDTVERVPLT